MDLKQDRAKQLGALIKRLRIHVARRTLTKKRIADAIDTLHKLGHKYKDATFPPLATIYSGVNAKKPSPTTLAEALLWKLVRWKPYKTFLRHYAQTNSAPGTTDIVFYAFAQHLKDREIPIFDQHAFRALWAISVFSKEQEELCKRFLISGKNEWKDSGTGKTGPACYQLFLGHMARLGTNKGSTGDLDKLLMPLGEALKKYSKTYEEFIQLCGR